MGRMTEARKRARQKERAEPPPPESNTKTPAQGAARAETGKIELPPSGLAADILARHESLGASPASQAPDEAAERANRLSFFAAPAREERVAAEATEHLATFFLDREEYGVDVRIVQEIRRVGEITTVPRAPDFIKGVMNLRGRIIPVVDLKAKLGLGEVASSPAARIVVVRLSERLLGLLVDGASQVLKVPVSLVEPPPAEVVDKGGDYIRGVAKLERRLIILVDLHKVLARELGAGGEAAAR